MVVTSFGSRFRSIAGAIVAAAAVFFAQPALANSSATADIAAPLRASQAAKPASLGNGDEKFEKLFNRWQALEGSTVPALAAVADAADRSSIARSSVSRAVSGVSIPSLMPVNNVRLTSSFGMREHPVLGGRRAHKGVDLAAPVGTPIVATADGIVSKAQWFGGYGLFVAIEHGGNIQTRYGHMSRLNVADGQRVHKGDVIGFIGTTGRSTGPHLHYEVRVNGDAVNPIPYMQADQLARDDSASSSKGGPE